MNSLDKKVMLFKLLLKTIYFTASPSTAAIVASSPITTNGANASTSSFRLASYYSDHMVLQMEPLKANIWGFSDLHAIITLQLHGKYYSTQAENGEMNLTWFSRLIFFK